MNDTCGGRITPTSRYMEWDCLDSTMSAGAAIDWFGVRVPRVAGWPCRRRHPRHSWTCSRAMGHNGRHLAALTTREVAAVWR